MAQVEERGQGLSQQLLKATFAGSNGDDEIESVAELRGWIRKKGGASKISLAGCTLQNVNLGALTSKEVTSIDWAGASLWGCRLHDDLEAQNRKLLRYATVIDQPEGLPFLPFRAFMYRTAEMQAVDDEIYSWYMSVHSKSIQNMMMQSIHDFSIKDALYDYIEGKSIVVVMGGHATARASREYRETTWLGYKLAKAGFVVATGGGSGSMEAANLGAYMLTRSEAEVNEALEIMAIPKPRGLEHEYLDKSRPKEVIELFGEPVAQPSLGISTYVYGHEPPSMFPTWQGKMFSNAIREDGLIDIGNAGIVYVPGGPGTRQEVFQAACKNHYAEEGEAIPMIFWDVDFWSNSGIWHALEKNSRNRPMHKWMLLTDDVNEIVALVEKYRLQFKLPVTSLDALEEEHARVFAPAHMEREHRKKHSLDEARKNLTSHKRRRSSVPLGLFEDGVK